MTTETQNVTEELKDFAVSAKKAGLTSGDRVIGRAIARIAELEAVVEKLPKTADGNRVVPSVDFVWNWCALDGGYWESIKCPSRAGWVAKCYSTRDAALAAKGDSDAN